MFKTIASVEAKFNTHQCGDILESTFNVFTSLKLPPIAFGNTLGYTRCVYFVEDTFNRFLKYLELLLFYIIIPNLEFHVVILHI